MRHLNTKATLLLTLACAVSLRAQPTPQQRHGLDFGTFSNLHYVKEGGDLLGIEITIIPQYETAYAVVQCAQGAVSPPALVPIELKNHHFRFVLQTGDSQCDGDFSGLISERGMTLSSGGANDAAGEFIPRRRSYWSR